jgi:hypothetical protein
MLEEMGAVYEVELERHLSALSADEADLVTAALMKVTGSTCDAEKATAAVASGGQL